MSAELNIPKCPENCSAAHTIQVAMFLLGISRTRLYELMNERIIAYIETDYGRRIRHNEIEKYLSECAQRFTPANTSVQ
jgi:helix-turn-helix protein